MGATTSTLPKRKAANRRKNKMKQSSGWAAWWPVVAGIAVTPFAVKAATLMALAGPDGLRLLYPWMLVPKLHFLGLSDAMSNAISQAAMYAQFPIYGVLMMLVWRARGAGAKGAAAAMLSLALIHLLAVGLVFAAGRG